MSDAKEIQGNIIKSAPIVDNELFRDIHPKSDRAKLILEVH